MAHILLGKELYGDERLLKQLRAWGVTTGLRSGDSGCLPGIWECDAMILSPAEVEGLPPMDPEPGRGPCAPILVWDGHDVHSPPQAPSQVVVPLSAGGGLMASLQVCVAHAGGLRDFQGAVPVLETNPLRVMGHELLTPLTAIKTALEILAEDDGEPEDEDSRLRRSRMVKLALRNANRLGEAMDWSCELLSPLEKIPADVPHAAVHDEDLVQGLGQVAPLTTGEVPVKPRTEAGPVLDLAGKMVQSLQDALPGYGVCLHLAASEDGRLAILSALPVSGRAPAPEIISAASREDLPSWDPWRLALEKAVGLRIPPHLAKALGGSLEIQCRGGFPCLVLSLPAVQEPDFIPEDGLPLRDPVTMP